MIIRCSPRLLRSITAAFAFSICHAAATAEYVLNTGTPTGINDAYVLYNDGAGEFQALGFTLVLPQSRELTAIDAWMNTTVGGIVTTSIWAGAPWNGGIPLFSSAANVVSSLSPRWVSFDSLSWQIQAGTYAVTFTAQPGYDGGMPDHAPTVLSEYWGNSHLSSDWISSAGLGIGVRVDVTPVPEPASYGFMLVGLALLAAMKFRTLPPRH